MFLFVSLMFLLILFLLYLERYFLWLTKLKVRSSQWRQITFHNMYDVSTSLTFFVCSRRVRCRMNVVDGTSEACVCICVLVRQYNECCPRSLSRSLFLHCVRSRSVCVLVWLCAQHVRVYMWAGTAKHRSGIGLTRALLVVRICVRAWLRHCVCMLAKEKERKSSIWSRR